VARLTGIPERKRLSREQRLALTRLKASARPLKIGRVRREEVYDRFEQ
jgi:antitoxin (DNA-binding transcriptional repressor) of toxin-antitoxin stability system